MIRKPTKNTRGPNSEEKKFISWTKYQPCIVCGSEPVIVHHCEGSCFKHNKILVGHRFVIPLCESCDMIVTLGSRKVFRDLHGPQSEMWRRHVESYSERPPEEEYRAILDWGR